jgi:protein MpaA
MNRRAVLRGAIAGGVLATAVSTVARGAPARQRASVAARADRVRTPAHPRPGWTEGEIGRSVEGRAILRWDSTPRRARRHVAIICGTHGDERAMDQLAEGFGRIDAPADMHLTIVPHLNPDGWAAGTRHNAANVDLNRNFPWGWRRGGFGGSVAGSEPETRAAMWFLGRERPDLAIWVHQPLGYVAAIEGCPPHYADIWSDFSNVPVRRNLRQSGGGETWTAVGLGLRSMLIEVGGTHNQPIGVDDHINALQALVFAVEAH